MKYSNKSQAENGVDNTTVMTPLRVKQSILVNSPAAPSQMQPDWNETDNTKMDYIKNKPTIPSKTSDLTNDSNYVTTSDMSTALSSKQDTLVSGTNIKTINNTSLLGSGNISVGGGASGIQGVTLLAGVYGVDARISSNYKAGISLYPATFTARYDPTSNRVLTEAALDDYTKTTDLATVATSGSYSDLSNKPSIPTKTSDLTNDSNFVVDASYVHTDNNYTTTEKNKLSGIASGAEVNVQSDWNETSSSSDAYIKNKPTIPTKVSDLTNDSGFLTTETDPVFGASVAAGITSSDITAWNNKSTFSGDYNDLTNKPTIPTNTSDLTNDGDGRTFIDPFPSFTPVTLTTDYAFVTGSDNGFHINTHTIDVPRIQPIFSNTISSESLAYESDVPTKVSDLQNDAGYITGYTETDPVYSASAAAGISSNDISDWNSKQEALVSGTNIKTINNQSILGSGNISIGGSGGTSDYDQLSNRPSINSVTLTGDKTSSDLGLASSSAVDNLKPVTLFENATGSTSNIQLSDSAANYNYLEVYYLYEASDTNYGEYSAKISSPNGKKIPLTIIVDSGNLYTLYCNYSISGTTMTRGTPSQWRFTTGSGNHTRTTPAGCFAITKVVGYK